MPSYDRTEALLNTFAWWSDDDGATADSLRCGGAPGRWIAAGGARSTTPARWLDSSTGGVTATSWRPSVASLMNQLAYLNSGSAFRASWVPPGRTIFLSTIFRLVKGTTTYLVPRPRKPPTDRTA